MDKENRCVASVHHQGMFRMGQCSFKGKVKRDGKWYCGRHDPVKLAKESAKREAKWDLNWKIKKAGWAVDEKKDHVVSAAVLFINSKDDESQRLAELADAVIDYKKAVEARDQLRAAEDR